MDFLQKIFFNLWYLGTPPWDTGISPPELIQFIETHPPGRALDLGCGTGTNSITLAKSGWEVIGIDFSHIAIHLALQKAKSEGVVVDLQVEDVTKINKITKPFDLILDIGCYHSLSDSKKRIYLKNINLLLSEQGTLLMYVFFNQSGAPGSGLVEADMNLFQNTLKLVQRLDGSERGTRPSAWLCFEKKHY